MNSTKADSNNFISATIRKMSEWLNANQSINLTTLQNQVNNNTAHIQSVEGKTHFNYLDIDELSFKRMIANEIQTQLIMSRQITAVGQRITPIAVLGNPTVQQSLPSYNVAGNLNTLSTPSQIAEVSGILKAAPPVLGAPGELVPATTYIIIKDQTSTTIDKICINWTDSSIIANLSLSQDTPLIGFAIAYVNGYYFLCAITDIATPNTPYSIYGASLNSKLLISDLTNQIQQSDLVPNSSIYILPTFTNGQLMSNFTITDLQIQNLTSQFAEITDLHAATATIDNMVVSKYTIEPLKFDFGPTSTSDDYIGPTGWYLFNDGQSVGQTHVNLYNFNQCTLVDGHYVVNPNQLPQQAFIVDHAIANELYINGGSGFITQLQDRYYNIANPCHIECVLIGNANQITITPANAPSTPIAWGENTVIDGLLIVGDTQFQTIEVASISVTNDAYISGNLSVSGIISGDLNGDIISDSATISNLSAISGVITDATIANLNTNSIAISGTIGYIDNNPIITDSINRDYGHIHNVEIEDYIAVSGMLVDTEIGGVGIGQTRYNGTNLAGPISTFDFRQAGNFLVPPPIDSITSNSAMSVSGYYTKVGLNTDIDPAISGITIIDAINNLAINSKLAWCDGNLHNTNQITLAQVNNPGLHPENLTRIWGVRNDGNGNAYTDVAYVLSYDIPTTTYTVNWTHLNEEVTEFDINKNVYKDTIVLVPETNEFYITLQNTPAGTLPSDTAYYKRYFIDVSGIPTNSAVSTPIVYKYQSYTIIDGGHDYIVSDSINLNGIAATVQTIDADGAITSLVITDPTIQYTTDPAQGWFAITDGTGTGAYVKIQTSYIHGNNYTLGTLEHTTSADPIMTQSAVSKAIIDDRSNSISLHVVGYVSPTAPSPVTNKIEIGYKWLNSNSITMPAFNAGTMNYDVYTWDGAAWSAATETYTVSNLDVWFNSNVTVTGNEMNYWNTNTWIQLSFSIDESQIVHIGVNETITSIKTLTQNLVVPANSTDYSNIATPANETTYATQRAVRTTAQSLQPALPAKTTSDNYVMMAPATSRSNPTYNKEATSESWGTPNLILTAQSIASAYSGFKTVTYIDAKNQALSFTPTNGVLGLFNVDIDATTTNFIANPKPNTYSMIISSDNLGNQKGIATDGIDLYLYNGTQWKLNSLQNYQTLSGNSFDMGILANDNPTKTDIDAFLTANSTKFTNNAHTRITFKDNSNRLYTVTFYYSSPAFTQQVYQRDNQKWDGNNWVLNNQIFTIGFGNVNADYYYPTYEWPTTNLSSIVPIGTKQVKVIADNTVQINGNVVLDIPNCDYNFCDTTIRLRDSNVNLITEAQSHIHHANFVLLSSLTSPFITAIHGSTVVDTGPIYVDNCTFNITTTGITTVRLVVATNNGSFNNNVVFGTNNYTSIINFYNYSTNSIIQRYDISKNRIEGSSSFEIISINNPIVSPNDITITNNQFNFTNTTNSILINLLGAEQRAIIDGNFFKIVGDATFISSQINTVVSNNEITSLNNVNETLILNFYNETRVETNRIYIDNNVTGNGTYIALRGSNCWFNNNSVRILGAGSIRTVFYSNVFNVTYITNNYFHIRQAQNLQLTELYHSTISNNLIDITTTSTIAQQGALFNQISGVQSISNNYMIINYLSENENYRLSISRGQSTISNNEMYIGVTQTIGSYYGLIWAYNDIELSANKIALTFNNSPIELRLLEKTGVLSISKIDSNFISYNTSDTTPIQIRLFFLRSAETNYMQSIYIINNQLKLNQVISNRINAIFDVTDTIVNIWNSVIANNLFVNFVGSRVLYNNNSGSNTINLPSNQTGPTSGLGSCWWYYNVCV